jgi:hypothetical protein
MVDRIYGKLSYLSPGKLMRLEKTQDLWLAVVTVFVFTTVAGTSALLKYREDSSRTRAVVLAEEVPVYSRVFIAGTQTTTPS